MSEQDWEVPVTTEKISDLEFDWELYPRIQIDHVVVMKYAQALEAGCDFPPIKVGQFKGRKIIVDGVHRIKSREALKMQTIPAKVRVFKHERELFAEAVRWNSKHGVGYSAKDIRENIIKLKKYNFSTEDIVCICHVPADEIRREKIAVITTPSGRKVFCGLKKSCNGIPTVKEQIKLKKALMFARRVAGSGCIPKDDPFWVDLVSTTIISLKKYLRDVKESK